MKPKCGGWFLFLLLSCLPVIAQPTETDRKFLADIRSRAEFGEKDAQMVLAVAYDYGGLGLTKDNAAAVEWYRKAAEQNLPVAEFALGCCYANGEGVTQNNAEAVAWYRKAAEHNFAAAKYNLGVCYENGVGVSKDDLQAAQWYRAAADQNDPYGQYNIGACYANGRGVRKDEKEAAKWLRRAADQDFAQAQYMLGRLYWDGSGVHQSFKEAATWFRKASEQNLPQAQHNLGVCYDEGRGVKRDFREAAQWFRKAAEQNDAFSQYNLAMYYDKGLGVEKDSLEAMKWCRKAAEQNLERAQFTLGMCYAYGHGVVKDFVEAYKWLLLSAAQGHQGINQTILMLESRMTPEQMAEGQRLARGFRPQTESPDRTSEVSRSRLQFEGSATGFFITEDGYLVTNEHVVRGATEIRLVTKSGLVIAKPIKIDASNDLALLKADGAFSALSIKSSRGMKMSHTVATVGFPNIGLQGFAPKFAKGEIAALSGARDDPRYFQVSVPIQPGNSGGPLIDDRGNVVGVITAKLNPRAALANGGALPENVNFAVKSSFLLGLLESLPELSPKLKQPVSAERKLEDVVDSTQDATVLVLVF